MTQHSGDSGDGQPLDAILTALADIDAHVEHVAIGTQPESNMNIVAWAIHNLVGVVRDLAERPDR